MALYRVELIDRDTDKRLDLGVYEALDSATANQLATKKYKNMIKRLETGRLYLDARETSAPADPRQERRRNVDTTGSLLL